MKNIENKLIKIISARNVNELPLLKDLKEKLAYKDNSDFCEDFTVAFMEIAYKEITIKDGTVITLVENNCFNDYYHKYFYYIKDINTYICMDCGLRQKSYQYNSNEEKILLPADWNGEGVKAYLQKREEKIENKRKDSILMQEEQIKLNASCYNCMYKQDGECCLLNNELFSSNECEDWSSCD